MSGLRIGMGMLSLVSTLALANAKHNSDEIALPIEIPSTVQKVHIPYGFDDNDNVDVLVQGVLEDSCKRIGRTSYEIDNEKKIVNISVTTYDYKAQDVICFDMVNPFLVQIRIGLLEQGHYNFVVNGKQKVAETVISKSTTQLPDAHLYAPVSDADLRLNEKGEQVVVLKGEFQRMAKLTDCMVMKEIQTYRSPEDVLVVLPIAEIASDERCQNYSHNFKLEHALGKDMLVKGEVLLHVRVASGHSLNRMVTELTARN